MNCCIKDCNCIGKRRYDAKQKGFGGQTKPIFHKKVFSVGVIYSVG